MDKCRFEALMNEIRTASLDTLLAKNASYSPGDDKLHNFNAGADVGGCTPAQAAWYYMTKHLVALRDKVQSDDFHDIDDLKEKCQDIINYTALIWCLGNEAAEKYTQAEDDSLRTTERWR